jgi:ribonuclease P protein component
MEFSREQADFPAEQPPSRQEARLPPAHADPRGSRDPFDAPPQGPQRAVGLTPVHPGRAAPMLPPSNRMRSADEFSAVVRGGARVRRGSLVLHHLAPASVADGPSSSFQPPRVGLVVGRGVGESVVRHRISRRLRAQLAARLDRLPPSSLTVVRALPDAAGADSVRLGRDLDAALERLGLRSQVPA